MDKVFRLFESADQKTLTLNKSENLRLIHTDE
ncbi:MAG: hypothetical protein JWP78_969 [Mucilaginibacter sp.]|nr:hypothetical protein [Mucilaginibacter sp.]